MKQQYFSILKSKYDQTTFQKFSNELLNDIIVNNTAIPVEAGFQNHIESFSYLGSYQDQQGKNLHILDVTLKTNTKIEQARTMQRNLIARYLKDHWLDGALVAFHNDSSSSWRLSFVKIEYKYDDKGKPIEELTPAKRYSFLVGEGEPSHTAQKQLAKIYELTSQNPILEQLEEAFGVEKVTKEFFDKYRDLFESVVSELKSNHTFQNEAESNNIDTESFAKKLLGQIVFLYFLQKKGWLGVPKGKSWGEGDKMFLRNIYNKAISENKNFFNNCLEVLFYETLNNPRSDKVDRNYSDFFQSKIPFLNGGLFDPQYDWKNSLMYLDNKLFDKILGVFDTYNFTVKEDEPLEKEVAVDPEMLGKVFENLLEENLRKGKGTYYTPREIVHYMCQESLINYIASEIEMSPIDVRNKYFPAYNVLADERFEARDVSVSEKIIESLKNIKIVDPACGSGAFLVGMLQQITQLRSELETRSALLEINNTASTEYEIKKQTIQNCIYGVDIDLGAIEIAKLRLWLSLVVDYDLEQIEPLPNLDYKIMQGNSLLEELILGDTSIKLYDSALIKKAMNSKRMKNLFEEDSQIALFDDIKKEQILKNMKALQLRYFSQSSPEEKKKIRSEIENIEHQLIQTSVNIEVEKLEAENKNLGNYIIANVGMTKKDSDRYTKNISKQGTIMSILENLEKTGTKPFFLWHLYFADVFEEKGGFDIVIANPPYGIIYDIDLKKSYELKYDSFRRNNDIYIAFYERGMQLANPRGTLVYISPNTFLNGDYFKNFRKTLTAETVINEIMDFKELHIFDDPTVFVCILNCGKIPNINYAYSYIHKIVTGSIDTFNSFNVLIKAESEAKLKPENPIYSKIISKNNVDYLDNLFYVKDVGFNYWTEGKGKKRDGDSIGDRVFYQGERKHLQDMPFLKGRDIFQYYYETPSNYLRHNYKQYLNPEKDTFRFSIDFLSRSPKIIYRQTANKIIATIDLDSNYLDKTVHLIVKKNDNDSLQLKYILALLNSSLFSYLYRYISQESEGRTFSQVKITYIKQLPIKIIPTLEQKKFITLANNLLESAKSQEGKEKMTESLMKINQLVYKHYGLTEEEVKIVEGAGQ